MNVRIGSGAGFARDRIDPAVELAERGDLDYLVFEVLGERTIAAANSRKLAGGSPGFDVLLERRLRAVLPACVEHGTAIITNGGAADPLAAGRAAAAIAHDLGFPDLKVAVILGDDVLELVSDVDPEVWETGLALNEHEEQLVAANAYIGADRVREALGLGADIVIGGRLADPSLFVGALAHGLGFDPVEEPDLTAKATVAGHLLECAGQVSGGYFADPVTKPVDGLDRLGFPFADFAPDGSFVISKVDGTGGTINLDTVREQLLYEIEDPHRYITPDVIADFTTVRLHPHGEDRVGVTGGSAVGRPDELKVTLGFQGGWLGEGQMSYTGLRAFERAELAAEIVVDRLERVHSIDRDLVSVELIGSGAGFRGLETRPDAHEVRIRVAARVKDEFAAETIGWEVEALYTNGPAGGGGARSSTSSVLAIRSCTIPRTLVTSSVALIEE